MKDSARILEALQLQPLSEEDKQRRHILGRLWGPIATTKEATRNGRRYNKDLWEKALADELFMEKLNFKSLFLELGHPTDREEIDLKEACACIPEMPKIIDGDLWAYVDILDTPNGKILKTLCDYGFVPGISSRGSGDIMGNNDVDPETFFLETWDIVGVPSVKKARLQVCESLNMRVNKSLEKALNESYQAATNEEKSIMKKKLHELNISVEDDYSRMSEDDIPIIEPEDSESAMEERPQPIHFMNRKNATMLVEDDDKDEEVVEETDAETDAEIKSFEKEDKENGITVKDMIDALSVFDETTPFEVVIRVNGEDKDIVEEDCEVNATIHDEGERVTLILDYLSDEDNNIEEDPVENETEIAADDTEEVIDDESEEVIESLKESIRQGEQMRVELKALKNEKAVRDAEVKSLNEELNHYKLAFERTSRLAASNKQSKEEIKKLNEALDSARKTIATKDAELASAKTKLTESVSRNVNVDKKSLVEAQKEYEAKTAKLVEEANSKLSAQATSYKKKINESAQLANKYRAEAEEAKTAYINFRANMLGVNPKSITRELNESYSISDINVVCESIIKNNRPTTYQLNPQSRVKIAEVKSAKTAGYDDGFEDLLELAGLK